MVQFHYVRFYRPKTRGINCITQRETKLALSRSDNSIEIWNVGTTPLMERLIPPALDQNVQGLRWCGDRLFSCDLEGFLNEYDLRLLKVKSKVSVTGEAAYCLDVDKSNQHIAVGTDQGYINIFSISDDGEVLFDKFLDKQEGKVICLKYDWTGNFIVTGSVDVIRIFDVRRGQALHKMSAGRSEKNKPTITWCLAVLKDFTIVTGDSRGKLTFWDGNIGAQIESYQSHKADMLTLIVGEKEEIIYCAGVDPTIASFAKVNVKEKTHRWVKNVQRRAHNHDVNALALYKNRLFSGGIDGYLSMSYHPPKTLVKYPPIACEGCISISDATRSILLQYSDYLELWKLGESEDKPDCGQMYRVKNGPKKLVSIERQIKDSAGQKRRAFIMSSAISKDGKWIAYSTRDDVNLLELIHVDAEIKLVSTKLNSITEACTRIGFCNESKELILATIDGILIIYDLELKSVTSHLETNQHITDAITHMTISNQFIVIGDVEGNIIAFRKEKIWKYYCKLPKYGCNIMTLAVNNKSNLMIVYVDNKIAEYILIKKRFSNFSKSIDSTAFDHCRNTHFPITSIAFDAGNKNIILLHDDSTIVAINKDKVPIDEPEAKVAKSDKKFLGKKTGVIAFKEHPHLIHLEALSENQYVVVEVNPITLLHELPPCLKQTSFGTA